MSAALGNMSKLYCSRLHENFLVYSFTHPPLLFQIIKISRGKTFGAQGGVEDGGEFL